MIRHCSMKLFNVVSITMTLAISATLAGCKSRDAQGGSNLASDAGIITFASTFELEQFKGSTYLAFMRSNVKPALDKIATDGYKIRGSSAIESTYNSSDTKVQGKVDKLWGGVKALGAIADKLKGQTFTMDDLPAAVARAGGSSDRYGISTFIGLASGGGVAIKYADENYSYNIHYAVNEKKSGRSYATGPGRGANDASDKEYLNALEQYMAGSQSDQKDFYGNLFGGLINNNTADYKKVTKEGQSILTDFFAVYTAEQARNLMGKTARSQITPYWEAALLEVTLLASFHSNQKQFTIFYTDPQSKETSFTDKTGRQTPCAHPTSTKKASLSDYWQFSRNIDDAKNCKRSGINISKREFRGLGKAITGYMYKKHKDIFNTLYKSMNSPSYNRENMYAALSYFLISDKTPEDLSSQESQITNSWIDWLETVRNEAPEITKFIAEANQNDFFTSAESLDGEGETSGGFDAIYEEDSAIGR